MVNKKVNHIFDKYIKKQIEGKKVKEVEIDMSTQQNTPITIVFSSNERIKFNIKSRDVAFKLSGLIAKEKYDNN